MISQKKKTLNSHCKDNTMESKQTQSNRPKSVCNKIGEEHEDDLITSQEKLNIGLQRRRHAINITNNPGYHVTDI